MISVHAHAHVHVVVHFMVSVRALYMYMYILSFFKHYAVDVHVHVGSIMTCTSGICGLAHT